MKILQVTTVGTTVNSFLLPYAKAFKKQGWLVDAAANNVTSYSQVKEVHDNCYDVDFCRNFKEPMKLMSSFFKIRSVISTGSYDVVHVHTPIAAFITRLACIGIPNLKVFYTAHGFHCTSDNPGWKNKFFLWVEKLGGYMTDHLFVINLDDYKLALQENIVRETEVSLVNGIGVDSNKYSYQSNARGAILKKLSTDNDVFVMLHVAELNENKNHKVILHALKKIISQNADTKLLYVIVGVGGHDEILKKLVSDLGLDSFVKFIGRRDDIPQLISASDVLCLSSYREGLPRCIMEAMCIGKPVIASDIRGCRDLVGSGSGILANPHDVDSWANAIYSLYSSPGILEEMGKHGQRVIEEKYQEKLVVDSVLKIYKQVV